MSVEEDIEKLLGLIEFEEECAIEEPEIILSEEQQLAFKDIEKGSNVLVTGVAGTGKSVLIREIQKKYPNVCITGTTGVSAVNVGGVTIHSWSGVVNNTWFTPEKTAKRILSSESHKRQRNNIQNCDMLIIDEISMLDATMFDKINRVFQLVRGNSDPFGGIQVLLFGDFLQLPPVPNKDEYGKNMPVKFCFQTRTWDSADIQMYLLTKVFRQEDVDFVNVLNRVRKNIATDTDMQLLYQRLGHKTPKDTIKIFAKNKDVDFLNAKMISKINEEPHYYEKVDFFYTDDPEEIQDLSKLLKEGCLAPELLELKVGVRVMMLRNYLQSYGIVNGSMGTVVGFEDSDAETPIVEFDNGEVRCITPQKWEIRHYGEIVAYRSQIPLKPAYAITIHKSQGMTLERAECNLGDCWDYSQIYVALSRVKSLNGLYLNNFDPDRIKAHPTAIYFYEVVEKLMEEIS